MPDMEFWHLLCIPSVRSSGIFLLFPNEEVPFTIPHKRKPKGMFNGGEDRWSGQAVLVLWIQDMAISGEVSRIFSLWGFMKETCTLETTENVPVFPVFWNLELSGILLTGCAQKAVGYRRLDALFGNEERGASLTLERILEKLKTWRQALNFQQNVWANANFLL